MSAAGLVLVDAAPTAEERVPNPRLARLEWGEHGYPAAMSPAIPGVARVIEVMRAATGDEVRVAPLMGGSLPIAPIGDVLETPFVIVPIVNADNNQHAPNENLRMREVPPRHRDSTLRCWPRPATAGSGRRGRALSRI